MKFSLRGRWTPDRMKTVLSVMVPEDGCGDGNSSCYYRHPTKPAATCAVGAFIPEGVYDPDTRSNSGTNADDLNSILRDLPLLIQKETVSATWDREDQILEQQPDLVLIHRSCFLHSRNLKRGASMQSPPGIEVLGEF